MALSKGAKIAIIGGISAVVLVGGLLLIRRAKRRKAEGEVATADTATQTTTPATTPSTTTPTTTPVTQARFPLRKGDRGEAVKIVQRYLNGSPICGKAGKITPLVVDGIWGGKTQSAIEKCHPSMEGGVSEPTFTQMSRVSYAKA